MAQEQRFELVSTLGRGGMAEVFLGWMNSVGGLRRKVAIKRILPELIQKQSKLFQQMFVDEARLAFQLEHDNIVRVYDVGQTANTFFIVMEYIEGYDLKSIMERLRKSGTVFPLGVALYITLQVCAGLGYAHTLADAEGKPLGLIHNDISPPNILVGRHGDVKVADFGLSDARSNDVVTPDGMIKGKFAYISPESTRNPPKITAKSDIFSIGICLWEMLAGTRLFQRDTDVETFKAVQACQIPDLRNYRKDIPEELVKIVAKALASDPAKRYQTCEELYLDISSLATALSIPINRYDLSWLVNDLAGNRWSEFVGEKVSDDMQRTLQDELGGMLPPGDAEILSEIVTGISEAAEVKTDERAKRKNANWVEDVFSDVGFDDGEVVFAEKKEDKLKEDPTLKPVAHAASRKVGDEKPAARKAGEKSASKSGETPGGSMKSSADAEKKAATVNTPTREVNELLPSAQSKIVPRSSISVAERKKKTGILPLLCIGVLGMILGIIFALILMLPVI